MNLDDLKPRPADLHRARAAYTDATTLREAREHIASSTALASVLDDAISAGDESYALFVVRQIIAARRAYEVWAAAHVAVVEQAVTKS